MEGTRWANKSLLWDNQKDCKNKPCIVMGATFTTDIKRETWEKTRNDKNLREESIVESETWMTIIKNKKY